MDLRIIKTRRAIREAFLQLRETTRLEQVKVKDLCELALINKTTFYKHYPDVFALSEELENELIENILADFKDKDCLLSDPERFISGMRHCMEKHPEVFMPVFQSRVGVYFTAIEARLLRLYLEAANNEQEQIMITFILAGMMRAFRELRYEGTYSTDALVMGMSTIIKGMPVYGRTIRISA